MTIVDVHHNETIYPDSYSFILERWLNSPKTQKGSSLDRCFGNHFVMKRSKLVVAWDQTRMQLYETSDMDIMIS
jgi:cytochrome P450